MSDEGKEISLDGDDSQGMKADIHNVKSTADDDGNKTAEDENPSVLHQIANCNEDEIIPWEEVRLPSKGMYYDDDKCPNGIVEVRAMTLPVEKIMANARLVQSGQAMDKLYEQCVRIPGGMDPIELIDGDRTFLLYVIRGITFGNDYEFVAKCPTCDASFTMHYDLNELVDNVTVASDKYPSEPFSVLLPYLSEKWETDIYADVRLLRGYDIKKMIKDEKMNKRSNMAMGVNNQVDDEGGVEQSLRMSIVSFHTEDEKMDGQHDMQKIISKFHTRDSGAVREFLRENAPGIDTSISIDCPECGTKYNTLLPLSDRFFRPNESRRVRE